MTWDERYFGKIDGRHGTFAFLKTDDAVGKAMNAYGEWSEAEAVLFKELLLPNDVVVEAGSNIGSLTVPISKAVGAGGVVHAFEPQGIINQLLSWNLITNGCSNTAVYRSTLGQDLSFIRFPEGELQESNNYGAIGHFQNSAVRRVLCPEMSVDALELEACNFIKVDVEGYERQVLAGSLATIERTRPIVYVETLNHYAAKLDKFGHADWLYEFFKPLNYRLWHFVTPIFNPDNFFGNQANLFEGQWSFDMICVPAENGRITGIDEMEAVSKGEHSMFGADPQGWRRIGFERG